MISNLCRIHCLAAAFALALLVPAPETIADVYITTGFAILENQSHFSPVSAGLAEHSVLVIDPTGREWSATVLNDSVEIKPGKIAEPATKSPKPREIARIKVESGKHYSLKVAATETGPADTKEKKKRQSHAPAWVIVLDPEKDKGFDSALLDRLYAGFANAPADQRRASIRTNREGAAFTPPATLTQWESRKKELREQLLVTQGLWPMWPKTPLNPKVSGKLERDGYTIEKVALETVPGFFLSGNLYKPSKVEGKLPAILSPHGHYQDGRMNEAVQARCIRLAKLGFVVFMYDMVGYNDSKTFKHEFSNVRLDRWGLNLVGFQTFNSIRALDWLETLPFVDNARIGCTGESGGGTQTFFLTAMDDRIAAAAPVVMISEGFQGGCVCENTSGMRVGTDNVEIGAMFAPKPLRLVGATGDWTANTMTVVHPTIQKVYALYGRSDLVTASIFNFEHNYNRVSRNAVYPFFAKWLQNIGDSDALREGDQQVESAETLSVLASDEALKSQMKSAEDIEIQLIDTRRQQLEKLLVPASAEQWQGARHLLATAHRVRSGVVEPAASQLNAQLLNADFFQPGVQIQQFSVGRANAGDAVPVVELRPDRFSGVGVVLSSPGGIAGLVGKDGKLHALVQDILKTGAAVYAYDALFSGASFDPSSSATSRPETVHFNGYNPTLAQDHAQDLATVVAFARNRPDCRLVHLAGLEGHGSLVLWARPQLRQLGRTFAAISDNQTGSGQAQTSANLAFTGWSQAGGLQGAVALSAPAPVWISGRSAELNLANAQKIYDLEGVQGNLIWDTDARLATTQAVANWLIFGK